MSTTQTERIPLQKWMEDNWETTSVEMEQQKLIYRNAVWDQIKFFRDTITPLFYSGPLLLEGKEAYLKRRYFCKIVGWHMSKSCKLPVYYIATDEEPIVEIVARNNFYNWNVTVRSAKKIVFPDWLPMDSTGAYLFFEGMKDWKEELYRQNPYWFSFSESCDYRLFATLMCIAAQVKQ